MVLLLVKYVRNFMRINIRLVTKAFFYHSDMVVYSKTVSTTDAVYIVGLSKSSDNSYKIHVVALSPVSGEVLATAKIPSVIKNGLTDFLVLSDKSNNAYIVWLQDDKILSIPLTHSLDSQASVIKGTSYKSIKDVGLNGNGLTIAYKADGSTQVISIHKSDGLKASWDFVDSVSYRLASFWNLRD